MESHRFDKRKGTSGAGGHLYEIKLAMLCLFEGLKAKRNGKIENFFLGSNVSCATDFDDVVFKYDYKCGNELRSRVFLLQAKHKDKNDNEKYNIKLDKLLSKANDGDFNLRSYLDCYVRTKENFLKTEDKVLKNTFENCEFIIFTNSNFVDIEKSEIDRVDEKDLFPFQNIMGNGFRIKFDKTKMNILSVPVDFSKLINELIKSTESKELYIGSNIMKKYMTYLEENVIEKRDKTICFRRDFLFSNNLSKEVVELREALFNEFIGSEIKEIIKKLSKCQMKVSKKKDSNKHKDENTVNELVTRFSFDQVEDFLKNLKLFFNQPREDKLEELLKERVREYYSTRGTDNELIYDEVYSRVQTWWKNSDNYLTESHDWFNDSKEKISNSNLTSLSLSAKAKALELGLTLNDEKNCELISLVNKNSIVYIITNDAMKILITAVLYQALELNYMYKSEGNDFNDISLDLTSLKQFETEVIDCFKNNLNLIILDTVKNSKIPKKIYGKIKEILISNSNKKIIILCEENNGLQWEGLKQETLNKEINFDDLKSDCQQTLMHQNIIRFQGRDMSLARITPSSNKYIIDSKLLSQIIVTRENLQIGKPPQGLENIETYFISRTLNWGILVNSECFGEITYKLAVSNFTESECRKVIPNHKKIFNFNSKQILSDGVDYDIYLLGDKRTEQDFNSVCRINETKSVHWLKRVGNDFYWFRTHGDLNGLRQQIDKKRKIRILPEEIARKPTTKFTVIAAEPGMGKSTLLSSLGNISSVDEDDLWRIRINLNDFTDHFEKWKEENNDINESLVCDFLTETQCSDDFERTLLRHFFTNEGKITIYLDGFDEICPHYKDVVVKILNVLKYSKVKSIWITTRLYVIEELENSLNIIAHTIVPFSERDQENFLKLYWKTSLKLNETDNERCSRFIKQLLDFFSNTINDKIREFIGIPLQLKMVAEVYESTFKRFYDDNNDCLEINFYEEQDNTNIFTLYESFIKKKYQYISCTEKDKLNISKKITNKLVHDAYVKFMSDNGKLALLSLYTEDTIQYLLTEEKIEKLKKKSNNVKKGEEYGGIIDRIIDGKPKFVHRTFAEYFVTVALITQLNNDFNIKRKKVVDFLLKIDIFDKNNIIINNFFNFALAKGFALHNALLKNDMKLIEKVMTRGIDINLKDKSGRTPLHLAAVTGNHEAIMLILKFGPNINDVDDIFGWQPIYFAAKYQHWLIVELLLKEKSEKNGVLEILNTTDSLLQTAVERNYMEIAKIIVDYNPKSVHFEKNNKTPLHIAARKGYLDMVCLLLRKKARVLAKDDNGSTPIHECAINGNCEVLNELIGGKTSYLHTKDKFKRIPLHLAVENGNFEMAKTLINMGSDINAQSGLLYSYQTSNWTPLHIAARYNELDIAKFLLKNGSDLSIKDTRKQTALDVATVFESGDVLKLLADGDVKYSLRYAILNNQTATALDILKKNPHLVNGVISDRSPLYLAARIGNLEIISYLLENGADTKWYNSYGMTPFHGASHSKRISAVRLLLERGGDPAYGSELSGWTALHDATQSSSSTMIRFYFSDEFKDRNWANVRDLNHASLLHTAALEGRNEIVQILLENGAKPNALDGIGQTPTFTALTKCHTDVAKTILRWGGLNPADDEEGGDLLVKLKVMPLHAAAAYGDLDMATYLIRDLRVDVNSGKGDFLTPLHVAALSNRSKQMMDYLVDNNGDMEAEIDARSVMQNIDAARWPKNEMEKWSMHRIVQHNIHILKAVVWCLHKATPVDLYECFVQRGDEPNFRGYRPKGFFNLIRIKIIRKIFSFELIDRYWKDVSAFLQMYKMKNEDVLISKNLFWYPAAEIPD